MDKINIFSSQAVLEVSSFSTDTRSKSSSPLVNSLVKTRLSKTAPDVDELPFQFIHTIDLSLVDTMLHDSPLSIQRFSGYSFITFLALYPSTLWNQVFDQNLIFVAKLHNFM